MKNKRIPARKIKKVKEDTEISFNAFIRAVENILDRTEPITWGITKSKLCEDYPVLERLWATIEDGVRDRAELERELQESKYKLDFIQAELRRVLTILGVKLDV